MSLKKTQDNIFVLINFFTRSQIIYQQLSSVTRGEDLITVVQWNKDVLKNSIILKYFYHIYMVKTRLNATSSVTRIRTEHPGNTA